MLYFILYVGDIIPSSIVSVSIRYGGLIDSITLHLSNGESIMSGGQGGSEFSTIEIPDGYKVVGFYGGKKINYLFMYIYIFFKLIIS